MTKEGNSQKKAPVKLRPLIIIGGILFGTLLVLGLVFNKEKILSQTTNAQKINNAEVTDTQESHAEYEEPEQLKGSTIEIEDGKFAPEVLTIKTDLTVTFHNEDTVPYTVRSDNYGSDEVGSFSVGPIEPGKRVPTVMYGIPGTYTYHLAENPDIKGTIIVTE